MADAGAQTETAVPEQLGAQGEPCRDCGAPLASDQRYCLNCGARRADPRVEYQRYMRPDAGPAENAQPASQAVATEAGEPAKQRDYAPLAAVAGIAVLGGMFLIGVLIGNQNGDNNTVTPPAVVVKGSGEESATSSNESTGGGNSSSLKGGGGGSTKHKGASKEGGGGHPVEASDEALNELNSQSGENYVEESKKIPDEVVTPGKPPPIDKSKPPGGGEGGAEVIK